MANPLVYFLLLFGFAVDIFVFLLSLLHKRFYCFEVLTFLSAPFFWEVVVVDAWVWLVGVSLPIFDDKVMPDAVY